MSAVVLSGIVTAQQAPPQQPNFDAINVRSFKVQDHVYMLAGAGGIDGRLGSRRCGEMSQLDGPRAHEREMFRPAFRLDVVYQTSELHETPLVNRGRGGETERDAMNRHWHLARKRAERAVGGARFQKSSFRNDLHDVDAIARGQNDARAEPTELTSDRQAESP